MEINEPFSSLEKDEPKSKIKGESATKNSTDMNSYFKNKNHILCFQCRERRYYKNKYPFLKKILAQHMMNEILLPKVRKGKEHYVLQVRENGLLKELVSIEEILLV